MPIIYPLLTLFFLIVFIVCLLIDSNAYEKYIKEKAKRERLKKDAEKKKKPKEFKWPENLPHPDS
jgi:hypothetical protein